MALLSLSRSHLPEGFTKAKTGQKQAYAVNFFLVLTMMGFGWGRGFVTQLKFFFRDMIFEEVFSKSEC